MSDSPAVTRVLFEGFAPVAIAAFYAVAALAIAIFAFGVYREVRKYRRGTAAEVGGSLLTRFRWMVATVLSHRTIARKRARRPPPTSAAAPRRYLRTCT